MAATRFQAGVIAIKDGLTCLVTNRSGRHWVIPKGTIDTGQSASEAALKEAWEEAGLLGSLSHEPFGSYQAMKKLQRCHITVYLLHVSESSERWPEMGLRHREWIPFSIAAERVRDSGLSQLLKSLPHSTEAAVA